MTATFVGMLLPVIAIVAVGDSLATSPSRSALIFAGLVLLGLVPLAWWAFLRRRRTAGAPGAPRRVATAVARKLLKWIGSGARAPSPRNYPRV
jgi:hypothetical protein